MAKTPGDIVGEIPALIQGQRLQGQRMDRFEGDLKDLSSRVDRGFTDVLAKLEAREQRHGGEVKEDLGLLKNDLKAETDERKALDKVVQARGRTHWPTVATALGMVGAIILVAQKWNADSVDFKNALLAKDIQLLAKDETETARLIQLLWRRVYAEELPQKMAEQQVKGGSMVGSNWEMRR